MNKSMRSEAEFLDSAEWKKLADKHLGRYIMPRWDEPCSEGDMGFWLERLNISKSEYMDYTNTSFQDWMALNQDWPLCAWIGLMCEFKDSSKAA